jgi:hypothetical protein
MRFLALSSLTLAMLLFCASMSSLAAEDDGGLSPEFTKSLLGSVKIDGATRALHNALTINDAGRLAVNRDIMKAHNDLFNHRVKTKGITDQ